MLSGHDGALDGGGKGADPVPARARFARGRTGRLRQRLCRLADRGALFLHDPRLGLTIGMRIEAERPQGRRDLAPDPRRPRRLQSRSITASAAETVTLTWSSRTSAHCASDAGEADEARAGQDRDMR